jgi:hypothetical protein
MKLDTRVAAYNVPLRPTNGRAASLIFCMIISTTFSVGFIFAAFHTGVRSTKALCILLGTVLSILSFYLLYFGRKAMGEGNIQFGDTELTVLRDGVTKTFVYNDLSEIILSKTLESRSSFINVIILQTANYSRFAIYDYYNETSEDIFNILKREFQERNIGAKFSVRPGIIVC